MSVKVDIKNGSIYLPAAVVDTYFRSIDAVVILIREEAVHVLPVYQMASGGCLLKMRNAAGDRVASAPDVFQANELTDFTGTHLPAQWSQEAGALVVPLPL